MVKDALEARAVRNAEEAIAKHLLRSGLPRVYRDGTRSLGDVPMSAVDTLNACQMLTEGGSGLFIYGPGKTYKTSIAAAFLASQIRAGAGPGKYVAVPDLMTDLYAIYSNDEDNRSRADIINALVNPPLLVLDDLGKEKASHHATEIIFAILDGRFRAMAKGRWTIITSNHAPDKLFARFPEAENADGIAHRISLMTIAVPTKRRAA